MAINIAAIKDLLLPGLMAVTGEYRQIETNWSKVFTTHTSNMQIERTTQMRYMSIARLKLEAGGVHLHAGKRLQRRAGRRRSAAAVRVAPL